MLVGAADHEDVVTRHPHVPAEDVGGHTETGHVADVARAVGVRPGDCGQDMGHGPNLVSRASAFPPQVRVRWSWPGRGDGGDRRHHRHRVGS